MAYIFLKPSGMAEIETLAEVLISQLGYSCFKDFICMCYCNSDCIYKIFILCMLTYVNQKVQAYAAETHRWIVLPLHSALSFDQQDKVHEP